MIYFIRVFSQPIYFLRTVLAPSRSLDVAQIGVIKQALLLPPYYGVRNYFYREKKSALPSLVDSHQIWLTRRLKRYLQLVSREMKSPYRHSNR